jgi:hypothetical protein
MDVDNPRRRRRETTNDQPAEPILYCSEISTLFLYLETPFWHFSSKKFVKWNLAKASFINEYVCTLKINLAK